MMKLKEPWQSLKESQDFHSKLGRIIYIPLALVAIPFGIYMLYLYSINITDHAKIFCELQENRIGVSSELYSGELRLFYQSPSDFEILTFTEKQDFYNAIVHIDSCQIGEVYKQDYNGLRKFEYMNEFTNSREVVYVLEEFLLIR